MVHMVALFMSMLVLGAGVDWAGGRLAGDGRGRGYDDGLDLTLTLGRGERRLHDGCEGGGGCDRDLCDSDVKVGFGWAGLLVDWLRRRSRRRLGLGLRLGSGSWSWSWGTDRKTVDAAEDGARSDVNFVAVHSIAAWKLVEGTSDVLSADEAHGANFGLIEATGERILGLLDGEDGAVEDGAGIACAGLDSCLEDILPPGVHEITVIAAAGSISVRKDEASVLANESIGLPVGLKKKRRKADGVRVRAAASVHSIGVSHVRLVVLGIEVDSIPAAGERQIGAHKVALAREGILGRKIDDSTGRSTSSSGVSAHKADGTLGERGLAGSVRVLSPLPLEHRTGNHAESGRESLDGGVVGALLAAQKVIHEQAIRADGSEFLGCEIFEIELGLPIGGPILEDLASGTLRVKECAMVGVGRESWMFVSACSLFECIKLLRTYYQDHGSNGRGPRCCRD